MEYFRQFIFNYNIEVILALIILVLFFLFFVIILQFRISSINKRYKKLIEGTNHDSLEEILMQHLQDVKEVKNQLENVKEYCKELNERLALAITRVGFIRYNAFSDMGSDLSFSIALLNDKLDGFVLTSIYGRDESTTYGKPIINGKSKYTLSVEEIQAIDRAKNDYFNKS